MKRCNTCDSVEDYRTMQSTTDLPISYWETIEINGVKQDICNLCSEQINEVLSDYHIDDELKEVK